MMAGFDADELALVRASLRNVLDSNPAGSVPGALLDEGWLDLVAVDAASAVTVLCEEAGSARSSAPALDLAMLWGAGLDVVADSAAVIDGLVLDGAERAERFVHFAPGGVSSIAAGHVELVPAGGIDPTLGVTRAVVDGAELVELGDAATARRAIAVGRLALASQMVGAADRMLEETLAYVMERHQYRRAIGSFQTVKHRLADVKVASAVARSAISAAWEAGDDELAVAAMAAMAAKCLAGRAHQVASDHCFQVHGGIAFTVEHGFQQWVRRGLLLDLLLGGHDQLTAELGRELIAAGKLPRMPQLR